MFFVEFVVVVNIKPFMYVCLQAIDFYFFGLSLYDALYSSINAREGRVHLQTAGQTIGNVCL